MIKKFKDETNKRLKKKKKCRQKNDEKRFRKKFM